MPKEIKHISFLSDEPVVRLTKSFTTPFKNVIATARTCYSARGIIDDVDVDLEKFNPLAQSIYGAGHHTTFQHAHFQFALSNISRQFIWSYLHSHPFYNSEQVSQRYVPVGENNYAIPPLDGKAKSLYISTVSTLFSRYRKLTDLLVPVVEKEFFTIFPARKKSADKYASSIRKRAMEAARYVLPVSMFAYMYHTISGITLLRYFRLCGQQDTPLEQRIVARKMIEQLLEHDSGYAAVLEDPADPSLLPENSFPALSVEEKATFRSEFDTSLEGHLSRLVDYKVHAEKMLADSVREVLGSPVARLSDEEAIDLVLNPGKNRILGESLVLTTHSKLSRALYHVHYTFRRKISHSADSQDQRHRMTPGSRPILAAQMSDEPDYITPVLLGKDEKIRKLFDESMSLVWETYAELKRLAVPEEYALYILPNALSVRFTESADLLNLHHKYAMRLCYNAQEEIWNVSLDEAKQITQVHPQIGKHLLPPCTIRDQAGIRPVCPEGSRYCGVKVWKLEPDEYSRLI